MEENPTVTGEFTARYTIERELGRGGAAVVYLARDNRQERHVALKVLHKELAQAIGAQRFLREIKHSSALQHPHLLTILDSGESRGTLYFVMPYMPDGSLRARIAREKQLPIDDALRITKDIGEALAYAHSKGIVHRDIKPDNVLFSADHACLADFGIARAIDSVAADTLTSTGLVVGTPAYMSPEQASGEKTVDARSDQYSLACLLYEMITGLPPFIGATQQSVISQRFTQPPPSMRAHRPNVPDHVERAVKRALAVVPADRFASVTDFIAALHDPGAAAESLSVHRIRRRWFAVGAAAAVVTLAVVAAKPGVDWARGAFAPPVDTSRFVVLPFLSEQDPAHGDRLAAGLYAALSRWDGLPLERDIAVRGALADEGRPISSLDDAIAVARRLGIGRLIWGRVTSDGGVTRVYADLYDVARKQSLSERVGISDSRHFAEAVLRAVADSLLVMPPLPDDRDDGRGGTRSFPAWQAYLRGIAAFESWDLPTAHRELSAAVEADADFGVAQLQLAQVASWLAPPEERGWVVHASRAVLLQQELSARDAAVAGALLTFGRRQFDTACPRYRDLIRADTTDAIAWFSLGGCLRSDNVVIPDRSSPSGWSFRSSWHSAGSAFVRAFELEPRLHAIPRFDWIRRVFNTDRNRLRLGYKGVEDGTAEFAGRARLVGDTIAYTPYPMPNFEQDRDATSQSQRTAALIRNGQILLDLALSWTRTYPRSSEAFLVVSAVRENRGELTGPAATGGALEALARARELATTDADSLAIGEAQVRVKLKLGRYAEARALADSVLRGLGAPSAANYKSIAKLAGLTGRVSAFESALQHFWAEHAGVEGLDQTVARAGGELLARSALALCGPALASAEQSVRQLLQSRVQPERRAEIQRRVLSQGLSYMTACTNGRSMASATRDESPIARAQIAFANGNVAQARVILDTLERNRASMRAGDMAVNLAMREASLHLQMGDTAKAVRILQTTLDALPTLSASIFEHPLEGAMLVRAMLLRADLATVVGDADMARKWSRTVLELWRDAEAPLKPTLARMQRLSQMRASESR